MTLNLSEGNIYKERHLRTIMQSKEFIDKFPTITHFFTTSNFGHIDIDEPEIYKKFRQFLGKNSTKIVFAGQPHGKKVCFVDGSQSIIYGHDGLLTSYRDVALVIRTADCLPILVVITDNDSNPLIIGAIHAGRRGLVEGIIESFINFMISEEVRLKTGVEINPKNAHFLIGPHICAKCYSLEINNEHTIDLINQLGEMYFSRKDNENKVYFNMLLFARDKLTQHGVPIQNIYSLGVCTYENNQTFPSYRYNHLNGNEKSLLFGSVICLS